MGPGAAVFQLIKGPSGDERRHSGLHHGLAAVGKMHRAFAFDHVKRLIGVVAMHIVLVSGVGIVMHPGVHPRRAEHHFSFLELVRQLYGFDDFDRYRWLLQV
jgi:hypothetical protein